MRTASFLFQPAIMAAAASRFLAAQAPPAAAPVTPAPAEVRVAAPPPAADAARTTLLNDARAALNAGRAEQAVRMAERYTSSYFRDPSGYVVLGNAYMTRRVSNRNLALRAYEEAMRLAPNDPEPAYLYARAGLWIGGNNGATLARRGLQRVLEIDPLYGTAWSQWVTLFRNSDSRRNMRERLSRHDSIPEVRARIAFLYLEDEQYSQADSILDDILRIDSTNVEWLAWRAQSAFEAGDSARGTEHYVRALTHAHLDTADVLWRQAMVIARPDEISAFEHVPPPLRGQWLASFWAGRSPDLFGGTSARLVEHFQRLRYARRAYPLEHALAAWSRAQRDTGDVAEPTREERAFYRRCEVYLTHPVPSEGGPSVAETSAVPPALASLLQPLAAGDDAVLASPHAGMNLAAGLDDRGLVYLRLGPPRRQETGGRNAFDPQCRTPHVEMWQYDDVGELRFARPQVIRRGSSSSDMVLRAASQAERDAMHTALSRDASSQPAPLPFQVWLAHFSGSRPGVTEIAVVSSRGALAASLIGPDGVGPVRRSAAGWVLVEGEPGQLTLLAHVRDSGRLGRQELAVDPRSFATPPTVSDLLVSEAWNAPVATRYDMLRHVARNRTIADGSVARVYAELSGLVPEGNQARYRVTYSLLKSDQPERDMAREDWRSLGAAVTVLTRQALITSGGYVRESADITPERLGPGTWLVRLDVFDLVSGAPAGRGQTIFYVR